jgi:hypothetical protein
MKESLNSYSHQFTDMNKANKLVLRKRTNGKLLKRIFLIFGVFNAIFSNISAISSSWRPVLVVEEVGVPGDIVSFYL